MDAVSPAKEAKAHIKSLGDSLRQHQLAIAKATIAKFGFEAIQGIPWGALLRQN